MLHEQFEHQNVANSFENETFELKNAASTIEMAVSSSKMLQMQGTWTGQEIPKTKATRTKKTKQFRTLI
jgi:hypothetical protein